MDGAGDRFQQEAKYHRERMLGKRLDWERHLKSQRSGGRINEKDALSGV